ncbi:MAG: hypothetical protein IH627_07470 [Rubrivivax sp.]|nr:hypothetical protein [Rubrivivax sp.]
MVSFVTNGIELRLPRLRRALAGLLSTLTAVLATAAQEVPTQRLTLLEGDAIVVDGARVMAAAAGLVLKPWSIVETQAGSRLVRIEFADGSMADLGPQTRVMVAPRGFPAREGKPPALYLLAGWVKQTSAPGSPAAGLATPALDLLPFTGAVVVHATPQAQRVFVEAGRTQLVERRRGGTRAALANGEMYAAEPGTGGAVTPRPSSDFVAAMPRMFRERIPSQAARFKDATVDAAALPSPSYASLRDWLVAEPLIRRDFPRRFGALARQGAFRSALEAGLAQHPEWTPVLYPPPPPPKPP